MRTIRGGALATLCAGAVLLTGCGASPPRVTPSAISPTSPATSSATASSPAAAAGHQGDCPGDIVAVICADVSITGPTPFSGHGAVTAPEPPGSDPSTRCAALAAGGRDVANLGDHLEGVAGHVVAWDTAVSGYHGPGTYPATDFHLSIDQEAFFPGDAGRVSVAIGTGFSVTITMTDLLSSDDTPTSVSGTISWTCTDPRTSA